MIIIGMVFGIVNSLIRPIVKFFTFPFIILTLGLFTFIINTLMLLLTESLSETFNLGLQIHGFWPAFWGALIISIVSTLLSWLTGAKEIKHQRNR
jgi:putative membrane protein